MLRKSVLALTALLLAGGASAQTVDELVARHIESRGGMARLKAVNTIRLTGKATMGPGIEAPVVLEIKRPKQMRMEMQIQGMTAIQAYDGKVGWSVAPFMGRKDPEPVPPEAVKDMDEQADIDGPLVDWKQKGHTVELVGRETVEGTSAYKLKLTLKNGDVRHMYLDPEHALPIKGEGKRTVRGSEMETEMSVSDYKEVEGLMIPHSFESSAKGRPEKQKITIEKVEMNVPLEDARFKMPEVKAPAASPAPPAPAAPAKAPSPVPSPRD